MAKDYYTVTPDPLEVKGGKVSYDVNGQFPAMVFNKKCALELTPELVYANGKTPFPSVVYQGEKFPGNYTVVPYDEGKSVSYSASTDYKPALSPLPFWYRTISRLPWLPRTSYATLRLLRAPLSTSW